MYSLCEKTLDFSIKICCFSFGCGGGEQYCNWELLCMIVFSPLWIKIKVTDPDYFSFTLLLWLKLPVLVTVIRKSPPFRKWQRFPSQWVCLVCFHVDKAREGFISSLSVFPPALTSELQCSPPPLTKQDNVYSQALYFLPPMCSYHLSQSHSPVAVSLRSLHLGQRTFNWLI